MGGDIKTTRVTKRVVYYSFFFFLPKRKIKLALVNKVFCLKDYIEKQNVDGRTLSLR